MTKKIILPVIFWAPIIIINVALIPMHHFDNEFVLWGFVDVIFYIAFFYLNVLYLFPKLYEKKRLIYSLIIVAIIIFGSVFLSLFMIDDGRREHHPHSFFNIFSLAKQLIWLVLIFFTSIIYSFQVRLNQQTLRNKQIVEEKLQTELQLLKAQINPHFLFNALNNIYSLTYMQSARAPESVLKLSEMLRYVIEDCCNENVSLKNEIAYINSFIEFYKMKNPGDRNITFNCKLDNPEVRIAPMLFIPFIENSFKYSRIEEDEAGFININLIVREGYLTFAIRNSIFSARKILPGSGKGIDNVKQRLNIIYPEKHKLSINQSENEFIVSLNINLL